MSGPSLRYAALAAALAMSSQMGAVEVVDRPRYGPPPPPRPPRVRWKGLGTRSNDRRAESSRKRAKRLARAALRMRTDQRMRAKGKR